MTIQAFVGGARVLLAAAFTVCALATAFAEDGNARFNPQDLDTSVRPGDDFDAYASGGWRRRTKLAADQESTGTVDEIVERTQTRLRELIEAGSRDSKQAALIADLYSAFMDDAAVERHGDKPLRDNLAALDAIADKNALAEFMGQTQTCFGKSFFTANVWVDAKQPTVNVLRISQDGLGMHVREAYLGDGVKKARAAYQDYIARTLSLIGRADAERRAAEIVTLETKIAEASWSIADNNDRDKRYNPVTVAELDVLAPGFPWRGFLRGLGAERVERLIALQKSAFPKIAAIFAETPLDTLKAWEAFHIVDTASPYLPRRFGDNAFSFRGKVERGLERREPRWKLAVKSVNDVLTNAVGYVYVAKYFPPETRARAEAMAASFKTAFRRRIEQVSWMSPGTKAAALAKLERVRIMIGYPTRWRDYSELKLDRGDLYGSVVRAKAFEWEAQVRTLSEPVDPDHWFLPPQAVDAFSDHSRVAIGITAAILQAPLFDPNGDAALNYGGIGEAMGHELTHQFDDQGRRVDATGARREWWQPEDSRNFQQAAARLITQFDALEVLPGAHVNGAQTLSENIADLGGLLLALDAYHLSLDGRPAPVIDGMTGDQRLFLAWARVFRSKEREASLRRQALEGTHTPFKLRAIAPMRNVDAWYDAFGVKPGDKLYLSPEQRVRIW